MRQSMFAIRLHHLLAACIALAVSLACLTVVTDGYARPTQSQRAAARKHANSGRELFKEEKYAQAIEEFRAAEDLVHAPPHLLYVARALAKLGKLIEARETYQRIADERLATGAPPAFEKAQEAARTERNALDARIPKITVAIEGPDTSATTVTIDGVPVDAATVGEPLPLDPGEHHVAAEADGFVAERKSFELTEGEGTVEIQLVLGRATGTTPDDPGGEEGGGGEISYPPFILMGAGVLVMGIGGITGGLALGKAGELKDACPQNPCPTENESLADDANTMATVSTVSFIVGGLATAAGVGWLIWDLTAAPADEEEADALGLRIRPYMGPGAVGLHGRF